MIKEYELIVRKRISSFIEKTLRVCNYDFRHDIYKQVIYGEIPYKTELEEKFKNYYDSFMFLLHNKQSPFTEELLTKFLMLFNNLIIQDEQEQKLRIVSKMFYLDGNDVLKDAVDYHMFIYEEFYELDESQRLLISLMFFNYILVKNNIPCIQIVKSQFTQYFKYRADYLNGNGQNLYCFFEEIISKSKFQEKEFKDNLREISINDICNKFLEDKELLKNNFNLKNIYIFGSFQKVLLELIRI